MIESTHVRRGHADFIEDRLHVVGQWFLRTNDERDGVGKTERSSNCGAKSRQFTTSCVDEAQGRSCCSGQRAT